MSPENSRPIRPSEALKLKEELIPDAVFDAFNELIAANFSNYSAGFSEDSVIALMEEKGINKEDVQRKGYLRISEMYQKAGWVVSRSVSGESEPFYTFRQYFPSSDRD